jgi:hypothetical protein
VDASRQKKLFKSFIKVYIDSLEIKLPFYDNPEVIDKAIDIAIEFALSGEENFDSFVKRNYPDEKIDNHIKALALDIKKLVEKKGDSIWAFIFKNIYKPLFLKEKFDVVIGNPPWLVYNRMPIHLQKIIKDFIKRYELRIPAHQIIHTDIATLFFVNSFVNFLKENGIIAFVLPYSVIIGDQNTWFRNKNRYKGWTIEFLRIYDLLEVKPLFNVPSCVVVGKKIKEKIPVQEEIPTLVLKGKLSKVNIDLSTALRYLQEEEKTLYKVELSKTKIYWSYEKDRISQLPYADKFKEGATIVPRAFWFVEIEETPLGYSKDKVPVKSKKLGEEKIDIEIRGNIPKRFFLKTFLSKRMYPFSFTQLDDVILPLEVAGNRYQLLDYYDLTANKEFKDASEKFYFWLKNTKKPLKGFRNWLEKCQKEWEKLKSDKVKEYNILDWINFRENLTNQPVKDGWLVVYTAHGANPAACVIPNAKEILIDHSNFYGFFKDRNEALYVAAFINSQPLLERIQKFISLGLFGGRNIHKLIVEQPIPKYDPNNELHQRLVEIAEKTQEKAQKEPLREWLKTAHPNRIRTLGSIALEFALNEIDRIVAQILDEPEPYPVERIVVFLSTDEKKEIKKAINRFKREILLTEVKYRLLPPKVAAVKYDLDGKLNFNKLKTAVEFTHGVHEIFKHSEELKRELFQISDYISIIFESSEMDKALFL